MKMGAQSAQCGRGTLRDLVRRYNMVLTLALLAVFFALRSPAFLSVLNLKNIVLQNTHVLVVVAGLSFIMIGGGVDLSIGYQISLVSVGMSTIFHQEVNLAGAMLAGILMGAACGAVNGWLVAYMDVVPYAATLISQLLFRGASYILSYGRTFFTVPTAFRVLTHSHLLGIQTDIWIAVLCMLVVGVVFTYTFYGKYIKAMGEKEQTLEMMDVNVQAVKLLCYVVGGMFYALAAMILVSKQGVASPANGVGLEITGIVAVFLGGVSSYRRSSGYTDSVRIYNLVAGVLVLGILDNGIQLIGGDRYIEYLVIGLLMVWTMFINRPKRAGALTPRP